MVENGCLVMKIRVSCGKKNVSLGVGFFLVQIPLLVKITFININFLYTRGNIHFILGR